MKDIFSQVFGWFCLLLTLTLIVGGLHFIFTAATLFPLLKGVVLLLFGFRILILIGEDINT